MDRAEKLFDGYLAVMGLLLAALCGIAVTELAASYRAEPAEIACRVRQMESMRRTFSSRVTCVPSLARRDTLRVERAR